MNPSLRLLTQIVLFGLAGIAILPAAHADKPEWAGHGKPDGEQERRPAERRYEERYERDRGERPDERHVERTDRREYEQRRPMVELRFSDMDRRSVREYYGAQYSAGRCPPGLAKKNNGCLPPGQARKWRLGYPLPLDVRRYPLPPEVLIRLPIPPAGHEFVRVASDILLIAVGTGMVIDAVEDLGR